MNNAAWAGLAWIAIACGGASHEATAPGSAAAAPTEEASDEAWVDEPAAGTEAEPAADVEDESGAAAGAAGNGGAAAVTAGESGKPAGATVEETRTLEVIRDTVAKHRDGVRACFDALPQAERAAGGTLTLAFEIGPKGDVKKVMLNEERSTLKQPSLVSCAVAAFRKIQFPRSSRGFESNGNYPFDFKP